jgi:lipopolysaccharide/colanic/teichoic acid biosynthesis glycosyltransferase
MTELAYVGEVNRRIRRSSPAYKTLGDPAIEALTLLIAIAVTVFLLPLLVAIAAAIACQDGGPVLFRHRRIGYGGRPFYCLKFRTMVVGAESQLEALLARDVDASEEWKRSHKLRHDPRVTPLGLFLRRTSLDELPQLFNLFRGDMSLVGPRPIVETEIPRYGWRFRHYCAVKPGLTGLWQVSGRSDVTYRSRVAMDSLYAVRKTAMLDIWVLLCTVPAVLAKRGSC